MVVLLGCRPTIREVCRGGGAALHGPKKRDARRLLEAALKWAGITLLLVSCALSVYLGAALSARGMEWILAP